MKIATQNEMGFFDKVLNRPEGIKMIAEETNTKDRYLIDIERLLKATPAESPRND